MPTPHQKAVVNSLRTLRRVRGLVASYQRGEQSVDVTVIPHMSERRREQDDHLETRFGERTFLVEASHLQPLADTLSVTRLIPEAGDQLVFDAGETNEQVCELLPAGQGEAVSMPHDTAGLFLQITTKILQSEAN